MDTLDYCAIGLRLKALRKEKRLNQSQVAAAAGITLSFYGHIERGTRKPSLDTLAALCGTLQVDMHYIVHGHYAYYAHQRELECVLASLRDAEEELKRILNA